MDKRTFLKRAGVLGLAAMHAELLVSCLTTTDEKGVQKNWVWRGLKKETTPAEWQEELAALRKNGITGVFFGGFDEVVFKLAKKEGLETHVWMWTLNRGEAYVRENHPEWYTLNRKGESCFDQPPYVDYYRWLCPSRTEVQEYLLKEVEKFAREPLVDGVHLDYVRYCDVILPRALWEKYDLVQNEELPEFDYCYCEVCRSKFKEQNGVDPLKLENPPANEAWLQYRYDTVTNLVNKLVERIHQHGKIVSAAVFPTPEIAKKLVRQDWVHWNLDWIFPMIYHSFYEEEISWIGQAVQEGTQALNGKTDLYAGLYLPAFTSVEEWKEGLEQARGNGAKGMALFGKLSAEQWDAFYQFIDKA